MESYETSEKYESQFCHNCKVEWMDDDWGPSNFLKMFGKLLKSSNIPIFLSSG
jgi:hypothetical protein